MNNTVTKDDTYQGTYFTMEFLFPKGKHQPSSIKGLPRNQVYRFGVAELVGWLGLSEEESVVVIDDLLAEIDEGSKSVKHIFPNGESFTLTNREKNSK